MPRGAVFGGHDTHVPRLVVTAISMTQVASSFLLSLQTEKIELLGALSAVYDQLLSIAIKPPKEISNDDYCYNTYSYKGLCHGILAEPLLQRVLQCSLEN